MSFRGMLNQRCTIQQPHATPDGRGGQDVAALVIEVNVPCSLNPIDSLEGVRYQRMGQQVSHILWMVPMPLLNLDARFQFVLEDGVTYGVVGGPLDIGGRYRIWELQLQRMT